MDKTFEYEWWTVEIRFPTGKMICEYKGKSKDHVIKQIKRQVVRSNSEANLSKGWKAEMPIKEVYWDTLMFDRRGYQRLY